LYVLNRRKVGCFKSIELYVGNSGCEDSNDDQGLRAEHNPFLCFLGLEKPAQPASPDCSASANCLKLFETGRPSASNSATICEKDLVVLSAGAPVTRTD
jgi:hypothetical protein